MSDFGQIEEKVLKDFAYSTASNWPEMQGFFADSMKKETGFGEEYLRPAPTEEGMKRFDELKKTVVKFQGTALGNRINNYLAGYDGAHYLSTLNHPFPKPSFINAAAPLSIAIDVGACIGAIKGAILGMHNPDMFAKTAAEFGGGARNFLQDVATYAAGLKEKVPATTTEVVLSYVVSSYGSLRPHVLKRLIPSLDAALGQKRLTDLSLIATPTGTALN